MKRSYQLMSVEEEWKWIEGFLDYQVSNQGRVCSYKNILKPRILKLKRNRHYFEIQLVTESGTCYTKLVHRLVLIAFKPNPDPSYYNMCDHINRVTTDNRANNLRWSNAQLNQLNRSSVRGYYFCKNKRKYRVRLCKNGKDEDIGYFKTSYLARQAYLDSKQKYLKEIDSHHH